MTDSSTISALPVSKDIVLRCDDVDSACAFYRDELGFRLDSIYPADAPRTVTMSGQGLRLKLVTGDEGDIADDLPVNRPSLVVTRGGTGGFGTGRAGMQYRDLIPDRYGGRFIASHIRIEQGGPVPDYVHHHHIRFQLIYCVNGWVKVAYEDQGEPMVMRPGDCFLQPPHIRHRVLECSDRMEVVEMACPAEHETCVEHEITLPTGVVDPGRDFGGQQFVFHQGERTPWQPWTARGFECRDTGIGEATGGIAAAITVRATRGGGVASLTHDADIRFLFVREGSATLDCGEHGSHSLVAPDSCAIPPGLQCSLRDASPDLLFLEVMSPVVRT
jgi:quercetin dioxygenase-like cupin family protein